MFSGDIQAERILLYKDSETISPERVSRAHRGSSYKLVEKMILAEGIKKRWTYSAEELAKYFIELDQSKRAIPDSVYYKEFEIEKTVIGGYPCYFIFSKGDYPTDKIILDLHGGGFVYEMHMVHWEFAASLVRATSLPVCIPMYPIFPTTDPEIIVHFIIECYKELMAQYGDAKIITVSDSAGTNLSLSMIHYLLLNNYDLPLPDRLILISPAMVVGNDEAILDEMRKIEGHDAMLSVRMLETLPILFNFPPGELNWFTAPLYGDFSKFPPMYVFSGTYDIFYPQIAPFVERVRDQGKFIEFYTGYEMMHEWPLIFAIPECVAAFTEIVNIIRM
jgi:acetyl esterase/lipase